MSIQVLVVEDDATIGQSILKALTADSYEVTLAGSGEDAIFHAQARQFDLLVLDLGLPGRDGLEVLAAVRNRDKHLPVLILSARGEVEDRVAGLRAGADDYLSKPFSMMELEARLQVLLRRGRPEILLRLSMQDLELDVAKRQVRRAGEVLELTTLEFDILELLLRHARQVVSRDTFARVIWREVKRATPLDNVIDVHIGRLRKKLDLPGLNPLIHTVRGVGFLLSESAL